MKPSLDALIEQLLNDLPKSDEFVLREYMKAAYELGNRTPKKDLREGSYSPSVGT